MGVPHCFSSPARQSSEFCSQHVKSSEFVHSASRAANLFTARQEQQICSQSVKSSEFVHSASRAANLFMAHQEQRICSQGVKSSKFVHSASRAANLFTACQEQRFSDVFRHVIPVPRPVSRGRSEMVYFFEN